MESLLCDEVWVSSPNCCSHEYKNGVRESSFYARMEDCEEGFLLTLQKEHTYMPRPGYLHYLYSQDLVKARFRAIRWLVKSGRRLNLSFGTIFCAANYLDRFISTNHCREWKYWMVELLSLACLSIASKFNDTSTPSLHEIQMEELDHSFLPGTIQQMELIVLKALGWRLGATTAYSYLELLSSTMDSFDSYPHNNLIITRVKDLLLTSLLDCKLVEYPPSAVAVSAVWCSLEELIPSASDSHLASITKLFNQDQKENLAWCHLVMKEESKGFGQNYDCPPSPVTVLSTERINIHNNCHTDLISLFDMSSNKRKRNQL